MKTTLLLFFLIGLLFITGINQTQASSSMRQNPIVYSDLGNKENQAPLEQILYITFFVGSMALGYREFKS